MAIKTPVQTIQEVVEAVGVYPLEAFLFVQQGLTYTVERVHGNSQDPDANLHVGGRELCHGLRELAQNQWGYLAKVVLERWNISSTLDFGRIVFAMIKHRLMQKTEHDNLDDFRNVFDFKTAFEVNYRIDAAAVFTQTPAQLVKKA